MLLNTTGTMAISPLIVNNFLDSCAFDPKDEPEQSAANRLFELAQMADLLLQIAHSTQKELEHPNTPQWVKDQAAELNYTLEVNLTDRERTLLGDIRAILAGNGKSESVAQDAQHVFETQKYGHEMAHLIAPTHSERFVALLNEHFPGWREARAELNELPLAAESWSL